MNPVFPTVATTSMTFFGYGLNGTLGAKIFKDGLLIRSLSGAQVQKTSELSIQLPMTFGAAGSYQLEVSSNGVAGTPITFFVNAADPGTQGIRDGIAPSLMLPINAGSVARFTVTGVGLAAGSRNLVIAGSGWNVYTSRLTRYVFADLIEIVDWTDTQIVFDLKTFPQWPGPYVVSLEQSSIPGSKGFTFALAPPP
jgi:hypothetical protein